jgi:hypothetical protein
MIDPRTGEFSFEQPPLRFGPRLSRAEFLAATWAHNASDFVVNEPWHSWKLSGTYLSASIPFVVILYYHGEKLSLVETCHSDPKFGTSWSDYTIEKEMQRKESHDRWLDTCLGHERTYSWGRVASVHDSKGGGTTIMVRYK